MALPGLSLVTWSGWLFGIILLQKPWGCPALKSFWTVTILISLVNWITYCFMGIDAASNFREDLHINFIDGKHDVLSIVLKGSLIETIVTNFLTRLIFIFQAKKLAKLWGKLYIWNQAKSSGYKFYKGGILNIVIVSISIFLNLAVAIVDGIPIADNFHKSWLRSFGFHPFCIAQLFFLNIPFVLPGACGFAAVLTTLHHLRMAYEEFCKKIEDIIKMKIKSGDKGNQCTVLTPQMKEKLVLEFEEIQEMFAWWDSCLGPIVLVILSGASIQLVCSASILFLENSDGFHGWTIIKDIGMLMICMCKLYTLEYGHQLQKMFGSWKERFQKQSMHLPMSNGSKETHDVNDLYLLVDNWEWNLSACGFFDIDRKMVSGIIAYMVTYVVILVQIKISTEGAPEV